LSRAAHHLKFHDAQGSSFRYSGNLSLEIFAFNEYEIIDLFTNRQLVCLVTILLVVEADEPQNEDRVVGGSLALKEQSKFVVSIGPEYNYDCIYRR